MTTVSYPPMPDYSGGPPPAWGVSGDYVANGAAQHARAPTPGPAPGPAGGPGDPTGEPAGDRPARSGTRRRSRRRTHRSVRLQDSSWRRLAMYPVLLLMAGADAYGFWNTLTKIIKRDTNLVLVFVLALALGSVAAAHEIGRLARSRREGYDGSIPWMTVLALLWLALGGTVCWLRAFDAGTGSSTATGELAVLTTQRTVDPTSVQLAVLLFALYLLTGALALTHAYRFGDPRDAEIRRVKQQRERLAHRMAEQVYAIRLAESRYAVWQEDRARERQQRDFEHEVKEAWQEQLRYDARQETATHQHDPAATDALINPPVPPST